MSKKLFIVIFLIILGVILFRLFDKPKSGEPVYTITNDSLLFKSEYEKLNGVKDKDKQEYFNLNIPSYSPIVYASYDDVFKILDETGIIYLGYPECPWCRNLIPVLISSAVENNIKEIFYLNIKDDRNNLTLNKNNKIITKKKGKPEYLELVDALYNYLDSYKELNDDSIKRIYVPLVIFVKNGKIIGLQQSLSSYCDRVGSNAYTSMNALEKQELKDIFTSYFKKIEK